MTATQPCAILEPDKISVLPVPTGYRILIRIPKKAGKTAGGIVLPEDTRKTEETASIVGEVIQLGPEAYADVEKFPLHPWCKVGDFVMFRAYSGTRFLVQGEEYRLLNDDSIEAVTQHPEEVCRP
jgi:co-chaperonin GroES (HSP10)